MSSSEEETLGAEDARPRQRLERLESERAELESENAALRERLERLESERAEELARLGAVVAAAQERAYWLDRWHLDLNALMRRRGASEFRAGLRGVRAVLRLAKRARRRLAR